MIRITLRSILDISKAIGSRVKIIYIDEPETVEMFLKRLMNDNNTIKQLIYNSNTNSYKNDINFMINGKSINLENGFQTVLNDMDDFLILPRLGGG